MKTLDFQPAQLVAALSALATSLVVLFQLDLTDAQKAALVSIIGSLVPVAWMIADSIIRHGRSGKAAAEANLAAAQLRALPADGDDSLVPATPAK